MPRRDKILPADDATPLTPAERVAARNRAARRLCLVMAAMLVGWIAFFTLVLLPLLFGPGNG